MLAMFSNHLIKNKKRYVTFFVLSLAIIAFANYLYLPPNRFPTGTIITIEPGETAISIARKFKESGVVRSKILLNNIVVYLGGERGIVSGEYVFSDKLNVLEIAKRITNGKFGILPRKVTIPEGLSSYEIAEILATKVNSFNKEEFLNLAVPKEGYLFPDTYYFLSNVKAVDIFSRLRSTFNSKISTLDEEINDFHQPLDKVIIMASILEEEARLTETRQIVAGILWKRLKNDMPLQVDGTFKYINGKGSADLTVDDLNIDSPYNTYKYKGLPPTPVSNPGLDAIKSAITPIETDYVYFLTDNDGNMRYAKTLEEHVVNKRKYLK